ncbi:MAG: peptidylprolyl isomerase [Odoribacteraceae bacterium]|jgi:peptidyl-prolyl cis-trans isomerase SurA|nr:peptidylprolyl isomerase [Odoribacteraceae bacterium]
MRHLFLLLSLLAAASVSAQKNAVDKIVAIVGDEIVLKSDIEREIVDLYREGVIEGSDRDRTMLLQRMLTQKLLLAQAKVDSVIITDDQVTRNLEAQLGDYVRRIGSEERLEAVWGKSMPEIRNDLRERIHENAVAVEMRDRITSHVKSTPSEIRFFYQKVDKDSLPDVPTRYEIQQIVVKPRVSDAEKEKLRNRLRDFREQVLSGETTFNRLAVLYSEDGESAVRGGELGYQSKMDMTPEFADAAFSLKPGRISRIVETDAGFHIIQYIDRQGELINVRQILLRPKIEEKERQEAIAKLDSIARFIRDENLPFDQVAAQVSQDKNTRNNGGLVLNDQSDSKLFRELVRGEMARQVNRLAVGEISEPFLDGSRGQDEYKIIRLKAFYPEHKANLEEDWLFFQNQLQEEKTNIVIQKWIKEKQANTYIHIDDEYANETLRQGGWIK